MYVYTLLLYTIMVMFINGFFLLYLYTYIHNLHIIVTVFQVYFSSLIIGRKSHSIPHPGIRDKI